MSDVATNFRERTSAELLSEMATFMARGMTVSMWMQQLDPDVFIFAVRISHVAKADGLSYQFTGHDETLSRAWERAKKTLADEVASGRVSN